jgi:cytochrome c553
MMRGFILVAMILLGLTGCDSGSSMADEGIDASIIGTAESPLPRVGDAVNGKKLARQCADCHGLDGVSARSGAPFIAGLEQDYLVRSLLAYRDGARNHEVMKQISDELNPLELADITAYYASLDTSWHGAVAGSESKAILSESKARQAAGHLVEACRSCHGQTERYQRAEAIPSLDGMPLEYFAPALQSYINGERKNEIMTLFKGSLTEQDIHNLGAYFAARVPRPAPPVATPGSPANGKIAARACAGCHGYNGNSLNPHIPNLAGQTARYLVKAIKDYRSGMRRAQLMDLPVQHLSNTTIDDLAAYFSRQKPQSPLHKDISSAKAFNPLADGKQIAASCDSCHGPDGNSSKAGVPRLTGLSVKYIVKATQDYQHGRRQHSAMQKIVSFFSDTDIEKAAYYYATRAPVRRPLSAATLEEGEHLSSACAGCHGEKGVSPDPAATPGLAGQDAPYIVAAVRAYANGGRTHAGMKGVAGKISADDLEKVAAYYADQMPQQVLTYLPDKPQQLVEQRCNRCHGERGYSSKPGVPRLAGQIESYIVLAVKEYQDGVRKDSTMLAMADVLSLLEIKAIAAYYARQ